MEKLCPDCLKTGVCWLKETAESYARKTPEMKDLTEQLETSLATHGCIANCREIARDIRCPNLNDIDPEYPGKKLL